MLQAGRLSDYIVGLIEILNEEELNQKSWEFWLHKDYERSYDEYRKAAGIDNLTDKTQQPEKTKAQSAAEFETTIKQSMEIANGLSI